MPYTLPQLVKNLPLLRFMRDEDLPTLQVLLKQTVLEYPDTLFTQGDDPTGAWIIDEGLADVSVRSVDGNIVDLTRLGPGAVVGELGLLDGVPRSATVKAADRCELWFIDKKTFDELRSQLNPTVYRLIRGMTVQACERIRNVNQRIVESFALPTQTNLPAVGDPQTRSSGSFARPSGSFARPSGSFPRPSGTMRLPRDSGKHRKVGDEDQERRSIWSRLFGGSGS